MVISQDFTYSFIFQSTILYTSGVSGMETTVTLSMHALRVGYPMILVNAVYLLVNYQLGI